MNMDWQAIMDSEVMTNYLEGELRKEANLKIRPMNEVSEEYAVESFVQFENKVKGDPHLLRSFRALQAKIGSDPAYAKQCDPLFAQAVMMLDLDEQE